jgi:tetratricopeptide (TPR) repeat protein
MRRFSSVLLASAVMATSAQIVYAQADARAAFDTGKQAYNAGMYDKARESFLSATHTDPKNAEAFLWLGKADYQLGLVDDAIAAWTTTLKLAPDEPYSAKMLATLRGDLGKAENISALVDVLLNEGLYEPALGASERLLDDKALSDAQRARALAQKAQALVGLGRARDAVPVVHEWLIRYPKLANAGQTNLLLGQAFLRMRGEKTGEGLELLKKVVAENGNTPFAVTAQYELIGFDLEQGVTAERVEALAKWINANPTHPRASAARLRLVDAYLSAAAQLAAPRNDAALSKEDATALESATTVFKQTVSAEESLKLTQRILQHIENRYLKNESYRAAIAAAETLVKAPLPRSSRILALRADARYRTASAIHQLENVLAATPVDDLKGDNLPAELAEVVRALSAINQEFPAEAAWAEQANLAERIRQLALAGPPPKSGSLKAPHSWAVQLALPVIKADADDKAVSQAINTITAVMNEMAANQTVAAQKLAANLAGQLVANLNPENPAWAGAILKQVDFLDAIARSQFAENRVAGNAALNDQLSPTQQELIDLLGKLVSRQASRSSAAVDRLGAHLELWVSQGRFKLVEDAYTALARSIPPSQQKPLRLALARVWIMQADREDQRLLAAGLTPAHQLNPLYQRALAELYALQSGLEETDPLIVEVRNAWNAIITHYKKLGFYDVAEQAIAVKAQAAVASADAHALLQLARLREEEARRDLEQLLKQHNAAQKLVLTAGFKSAIETYQKFITTYPANPFVDQAAEGILNIGREYEGQGAYDVAVSVYKSLADFASKQKGLSQSTPGIASMADRAAMAVADALDAKARAALNKWAPARQPETAAPAKISDEFAAALASYKDFVKARPDSPLLGQAIGKIMAIALDYARIDAWDVADSVYADLLSTKLPLREPERLEFARAVTQLGKAMPEHAREVLTALTAGTLAPPAASTPIRGGGFGGAGGGRGGGGQGLFGASSSGAERSGMAGATELPAARSTMGLDDLKSAESINGTADFSGDRQVLAAISQSESRRAAQVAAMRDSLAKAEDYVRQPTANEPQQQIAHQEQIKRPAINIPVLSEAELSRLETVFSNAYKAFSDLRKKYPTSPVADLSRAELLSMVTHWRTLSQWQRAAALAQRFITDNPTDAALPHIRLQIARDYLAYAAQPIPKPEKRQAMLAEVSARFEKARAELTKVVNDFPDDPNLRHQAQWDIATSFLSQARVVDAFSPTLSRGQYARAARELQRIARRYAENPNIAQIPQLLWSIGNELSAHGYNDEAIAVWQDLINFDPTNPLAIQAAPQIASVYQSSLNRPLKAVEVYLEINFSRGADVASQNAIFQMGVQLKNEKRWVEALSVLETFVDSFPKHASAGQALTMIGQIHQTNEAWADAIAAYRRVIDEYGSSGNWVQESRWSIAECIINLSHWREAIGAYEDYVKTYPGDAKVAEANRRIGILKDLDRYQTLVDEPGQRKNFDAQFQIATIIQTQLNNIPKAIIEFRKVYTNFPKSHLADDALYAIGVLYLGMGETDQARQALLACATQYPDSNLADDALLQVGKSFEDEAARISGLTRSSTVQIAQEQAQRSAYVEVQKNRLSNTREFTLRIKSLKKGGNKDEAELEEANQAGQNLAWNSANFELAASKAQQDVQALSAQQLADRQDKANAALRKAVEAYAATTKVPGADKAGDALLRMAVIYDEHLKDPAAALATWKEIVTQFSGTTVAEEASWRIAQYYDRAGNYSDAVEAYKGFLRNYRRSPKAANSQFAIAESYEHLNKWVEAMDAYTNYLNSFPDGPLAAKAREQISWIKTYRL